MSTNSVFNSHSTRGNIITRGDLLHITRQLCMSRNHLRVLKLSCSYRRTERGSRTEAQFSFLRQTIFYASVCLSETVITSGLMPWHRRGWVEKRIELNDFLSPFFPRRSVQNTEHFTMGGRKVKVPGGAPYEEVLLSAVQHELRAVVNMRTNMNEG